MPLFGASSQRHHRDAYSAMHHDEEDKPLHTLQDHDDSSDHDSSSSSSPQAADIHPEIYALSRSLRRTNLFLKIITGLLSICIIALLSINVPETVRRVAAKQQGSSSTATAPLIKTPVPDLGRDKVVFQKHPIYSQRPNDISDAAWNKLLPPGRGFVYIPDWKQYDLPPGQETDYGMIYSTAVFHQMHCLGQVRRFSWMFLDAIADNDTAKQAEITEMFIKHDHVDHMNHCFDYLRQTIQCAGDMAMEWPRTEPDGRRFAVDGWGIPHECKNWNVIEKYMDKAHFDHSTNEDIAPLVGASG